MKHRYVILVLIWTALSAGCATQLARFSPPQKVVVSQDLVGSYHPNKGTRTISVPVGEYLRFYEDERYIYYRQENASFVRKETQSAQRPDRVRSGGFQLHKRSGNWFIYLLGAYSDMSDDGAPGICYFTEPKIGDKFVIQEVFIGSTGSSGKLDASRESEKWGWLDHPEAVMFVGSLSLQHD